MSELTHDKDLIVARIEKLEAQNRILKRGALAFWVAIVPLGLMGQTQRKTTRPATPAPAPTATLPANIEA